MRAGFGLGRIHHLYARADRERVVHAALDAGFRHFDVAPAYGDGMAERELGRILGSRRAEVTITTKFGIPFRPIGEWPAPMYLALRAAGKAIGRSLGADYSRRDFSPVCEAKSLEESLRRLRTDYVDFLLVHEPLSLDEFRRLGDTWAELERQQTRGTVRRFGVSGLTPMVLEAESKGLIPTGAVRMIQMCDAACALGPEWFASRDVFVFNIVKHLSRSMGPGRIDGGALVERFVQAFPRATPIFSTHRVDEIRRLGSAMGALAPERGIADAGHGMRNDGVSR
ncbi:MAG: aldo/keto reductase [Phycisphaerales bacterium]